MTISSDPKSQKSKRASCYGLRQWIVFLAIVCVAPAGLLFLAIDIQQSRAISQQERSLESAESEAAALSAAARSESARVSASLAAAFSNADQTKEPTAPFVAPSQTMNHNGFEVWWGSFALFCVVVLWLALVGLLVEFRLSRRIRWLRRVAHRHSVGAFMTFGGSFEHIAEAATPLAVEISRMSTSINERASLLEKAVREKTMLLHEIHHRVKNNFAIIASLLSLHRKSLPETLRPDIRFLEEHIQATAIAYKVAYAAEDTSRVPVVKLLREVILAMVDIANREDTCITLVLPNQDAFISLDKAIALALCFGYRLPFYLENRTAADPTAIVVTIENQAVVILFRNLPKAVPLLPALRDRLSQAYFRQLNVEITELAPLPARDVMLRIPLQDR